jgi:hypothetical protein
MGETSPEKSPRVGPVVTLRRGRPLPPLDPDGLARRPARRRDSLPPPVPADSRLSASAGRSVSGQHVSVASLAALKFGDVDLACRAADRGVAAGEQSGHHLALGSASRMLGCPSVLERRSQTSAPLYPRLGAFYLKTAVAAARQGNRSTAIDLLTVQTAPRADRTANDYWPAFGPTNVAVHTVSVAA